MAAKMGGEGEVVLITGCSRGGIGHALALAFAEQGCRVVATARSLNSLQSLQEERPSIECLQLDVLDQESMDRAVSSTVHKFGRLDILVNNAGVPCLGPLAELPMDMLETAFRTNVFGAVSLIQKVVPHMAARRRGKIVNIGSIGAYASGPWMGGYTASKAALHALTDTLRLELKPFNVDVILVTPGAITSHFGDHALECTTSAWLSLYRPFEESIKYRATLSQSPKSTPASEFARKTVAAVLRGRSSYFAYGRLTTVMTFLYYAPAFVRDFVFCRLLGISSKKLEQKKST